jgi:arabinan endo-1,5-alpha-L-arabinosidase
MRMPPHPLRPEIVGPWRVLFAPREFASYVNDHTVVRGPDARWHLYGCGQPGGRCCPEQERTVLHGSTPSLDEPMAEHRPAIDHGTRAWAPGAIARDGKLFMYYGPSPTSMAHSIDGHHWIGNPVEMLGTPLDAAHRDHMVVTYDDETWLMYAVGVRGGQGCVSVHVSNDLRSWRYVGCALRCAADSSMRPAWGAIESPFVVQSGGWWHLFITYTDCSIETYHQTLVFRSLNPFDFGTMTGRPDDPALVARLHAHAAEVFVDESGAWHITTSGWLNKGTPHEGCVSIAPLRWIEAQES